MGIEQDPECRWDVLRIIFGDGFRDMFLNCPKTFFRQFCLKRTYLYLQPVVNIVLTNVLPEPKLTKSAAKTEQNKSVAEIHFHSYCNREQPISFRLPNYPLNFFRFLSFTSEKTQIGAFGSGRTLVWTNRKFRNDALVYIVVY